MAGVDEAVRDPWRAGLLFLAWLELGFALLEAAYLFGLAQMVSSWNGCLDGGPSGCAEAEPLRTFWPVPAIWAAVLLAAVMAVAVTALHRRGRAPRWGAWVAVAVPPVLSAGAFVVLVP